MLSEIRGSLFHVDHSSGVNEGVVGISLSSVKGMSLVVIELLGEIIAIGNAENTSINVKVHSEVEISPVDHFGCRIGERHFMSLKEHTLGDSGVFDSLLNNVNCVIIKVIVDGALSNSVVF